MKYKISLIYNITVGRNDSGLYIKNGALNNGVRQRCDTSILAPAKVTIFLIFIQLK